MSLIALLFHFGFFVEKSRAGNFHFAFRRGRGTAAVYLDQLLRAVLSVSGGALGVETGLLGIAQFVFQFNLTRRL